MAGTDEFTEYLVGLMQGLGPVMSKRMFGGHGIFLEGQMFALVVSNVLYLKADNKNKQEFMSRGLKSFTYQRKGRSISTSYYEAPEEVLEDEDTMKEWAQHALATALKDRQAKTR